MARYEDLTVRLRAQDQLTATVRDASGEVDRLENKSADVRLNATDNATPEIRAAQAAADRLDGTTANIKIDASGLDDIAGKLGELPGSLGQVAGALGGAGGLAGGAAAIGTALFAAASSAADLAIEAQTTAELTGATVENASRLQAVWSTSGADVNDLNDVMLQMNGVLGQTPGLAKQLGVNLNDGKDVASRFVEVVAAIEASTLGASEKALLMSQVFGEEGVRQVAKLTSLVGTDLQAAMDDVAATRVITDDDVQAAVDFNRTMAELKTQAAALGQALGEDVLPVITQIADILGTKIGKGDDEQSLFGISPAKIANEFGLLDTGLLGLDRVFGDTEESATAAGRAIEGALGGVAGAAVLTGDTVDRQFGQVAVDALGAAASAADDTAAAFADLSDSLDAERQISRFRSSFLEASNKVIAGSRLSGEEILSLKGDILAVAEFARLTPAEVRTLLQRVGEGDVTGVFEDVNARLKQRPATVAVNAVVGSVPSASGIAAQIGTVNVPVNPYIIPGALGAIAGAIRTAGARP